MLEKFEISLIFIGRFLLNIFLLAKKFYWPIFIGQFLETRNFYGNTRNLGDLATRNN